MPPAHPNRPDVGWLRREYVDNRRSMADLADELGCAVSTVRYWILAADIEPRRQGRPPGYQFDQTDWR